MRFVRLLFLVSVVALAVGIALPAQAEAVRVNESALISVIDYSDTFTMTHLGGLPDRDGTWCPGSSDTQPNGILGEGLQVESCYLNGILPPQPPDRWWPDCQWTFCCDGIVFPTTGSPYPGDSLHGSDTGMTQTGCSKHGADWGIEYGLRDEFIVQYDCVMTEDRVDITISDIQNTIWSANGLSVFIRRDNDPWYNEISLFNAAIGEANTGLGSPILADGVWHNFAARFDTVKREVEIFVDEDSLGVVKVDTVDGGKLAGVPMLNNFINVGGSHYANDTGDGDRLWTDNFQVGIPEPGTFALLLSGLAGLLAVLRRKKA